MRKISFSPPDITESEISEVTEALRSGWITTGIRTKQFESNISKYIGTSKSVCLNSATAALELTLRFLGIGSGDEVITSSYTYTASAAVIHHVGAKVVLVDTAVNSYEMDYEKVADAITKNTKAIIPVDLAGCMCNYKEIFEVIENKKDIFEAKNLIQESFGRIVVVADSAHAFGASRMGKKAGQEADFTCFSFHAVKNLTTGEGGAVTWRSIAEEKKESKTLDEKIYQWFMLSSLHGQNKDAYQKNQMGAWEYDIVYPAYKCNMTDIMAAIGLKQLERYPGMLERRRQMIEQYNAQLNLPEIEKVEHYGKNFSSSGHLFLTRIDGIGEEKRNHFIIKMAEKGIACNVHYKPLPMLSAYKNLGFDIKNYPNAYQQYKNEITLPLHTGLSDEDVSYISENMIRIVKEIRGTVT